MLYTIAMGQIKNTAKLKLKDNWKTKTKK